MPVCVAHGGGVSTDDATCQCDREPAWCFVHRRWGRRTSSPPTRTELVERVRDLTATVEAQASDIAMAVARAEAAERERDERNATLRAAVREFLEADDAAPRLDCEPSQTLEEAIKRNAARRRRAEAIVALAALVP